VPDLVVIPKARRNPRFVQLFLKTEEAWKKIPDVVFSITCPKCKRESLSNLPAALIKSALLRERLILRSGCHAVEWVASTQEIEQIKEYLWATQIA
jgi:hypothetical protein